MYKPLVMLVVLTAVVLGCGHQVRQKAIDAQGEYLLVGFDAVAAPGETISLRARLQKGGLLRDQEGEEIALVLDGKECVRGRTDDEGIARVDFTAGPAGDYVFTVTCRPRKAEDAAPVKAKLVLAVRSRQAPFVVIDIDRTLAATRMRDFISGKAKPLDGAAEAVKRLAADRTVVYLTHRPDHLARRTKTWLAENGFPTAPLFGSRTKQFLGSSGKFKSRQLAEIRKVLAGPGIGIGDRVSDMEAYLANGLKAILIVDPGIADEADDLRELAADLDELPVSVQGAIGWHQVEQIVFDGASQNRPAMQRRLRRLADEMKRNKKNK